MTLNCIKILNCTHDLHRECILEYWQANHSNVGECVYKCNAGREEENLHYAESFYMQDNNEALNLEIERNNAKLAVCNNLIAQYEKELEEYGMVEAQ